MTAEVCLMNRRAVVLAADSATTVRYQTAAGAAERYFKGANKIIQLSNHHPIAVMIFDSADILNVPWETVAKTFRDELADKSFNTVAEYASEFFHFLSNNKVLFPDEVRRGQFLRAARIAAMQIALQVKKVDDEAAFAHSIDERVTAVQQQLDSLPFAPETDEAFLAQLVGAMQQELADLIVSWLPDFSLPLAVDVPSMARLGISRAVKLPEQFLGTTGLVFAGFGDRSVFPQMAEFKSCGLADSRHIAKDGEAAVIDHDNPAWLHAFAQTSMSDTFQMGFSQAVYIEMMNAFEAEMGTLSDEVAAATNAPSPANKGALVQAALNRASDKILEQAREENATPLRQVLGSLPVDEMAELAETLIRLQSLKEKVTKPSETVGGPIDVAVITKSEGMVWIKRKHFFDPALNLRYTQRLAAQH